MRAVSDLRQHIGDTLGDARPPTIRQAVPLPLDIAASPRQRSMEIDVASEGAVGEPSAATRRRRFAVELNAANISAAAKACLCNTFGKDKCCVGDVCVVQLFVWEGNHSAETIASRASGPPKKRICC